MPNPPASRRTHVRDGLGRHFDPDRRFELRLVAAFVVTAVAVIPFLLVAVLVEAHWSLLLRLDQHAAQHLNNVAVSSAAWVSFMKAVSLVLGPTVWRVLAGLIAVGLLVRRRWRLATWVVVTVGVGGVLEGLAKLVVHRHRPVLAHPVARAPGFSYPSGHAFDSFVGLAVVVLLVLPLVSRRWRPALIAAGALLVALVGFSRIGLGVHFVSDVLGGWLLAAAWVTGTTLAFSTWRRETGHGPVHPSEGIDPDHSDQGSASLPG